MDLRPSVNLRDDGDLKSMKLFKQSMQRYAVYIRKDIDLTPDLYYDIFINLCEPEMKKKLGEITGIREMGESKIWEVVEEIFMDTNPVYIRRVRAMNLQKEKGETKGDYFQQIERGVCKGGDGEGDSVDSIYLQINKWVLII